MPKLVQQCSAELTISGPPGISSRSNSGKVVLAANGKTVGQVITKLEQAIKNLEHELAELKESVYAGTCIDQ